MYRLSLEEIKLSERPWDTYETQLNSRGEQLFNAYLELFGSIAMRGVGLPDELADERDILVDWLLHFFPERPPKPKPRFPMPNLLTRSEHVQLGYLAWSLGDAPRSP